jgi:hypothetical protein
LQSNKKYWANALWKYIPSNNKCYFAIGGDVLQVND